MTKILIVDDKTENLYLLQTMLDSNGFKTISAKNGAEALGLLRTIIPDLIIADILMPVMDGFTLCRECKKDEQLKNIPFFFYTATYIDAKDEEYALRLGADRFILKPQEPDVFLKIINDFLEEVKKKTIHPKKIIQQEEIVVLKEYNEVLIRKIEDKMLQSERTEKELRKYSEQLEKEILEHKKSEASLLEREQQLSSIYRTVGDVIFQLEVEAEDRYRFISVNQAFSKVTGIQEAMIIGKMVNEIIPEPSLSFALEKYRQAIKENSVIRWEEVSEYPTGQLIGDVSIAPVVDDKGQCTHLVGTVHDITERILAERVIRESEEKYRRIFENVQDLYYETTMDGTILEVSPSIEILSGGQYRRDDLIGRSIYDFYSGTEERDALLLKLKERGTVSDFEITLKNRDGSNVPCSLSAKVSFDDKGNPDKIIGSTRNISERKNVLEKLKLAKEKAEESDRLKTAFLHNISHEIRTPMNAIVGFSALLTEPGLDEATILSFIDTITQSSNQLLAIISDIIEISNIEAGILKCSKNEIQINLVFQRLFDQFYPTASEKALTFRKETPLPDNEAIIQSDNTKFIQILTNLLSNAFKFTEKGRIEFGYNLSEKFLHFYVSDTGIGIPEDQFQRIFDRFYQVEHMMARHFEGTGLGLSISKAFVEIMGGKIWVDSEFGKGSVFYFTVPYNKSETKVRVASSIIQEASFNKRASILVAEDDDNNFNLIKNFLSFPVITLIRAKNGLEAVKYCDSGQPVDLVLMDLKMPEMNGYEATKKIIGIKPGLPVIAQTAFVTDFEKAYDSGCVDLITKPFTRRNLLEKIKMYLKD